MPKPRNVGKTIKRLFSYLGGYKFLFLLVFLCIIISSGAMIVGNYMLRPVLNKYIIPLIGQQNPNLAEFFALLMVMLLVYVAGVVAQYANNRIMLNISIKTLFKIRTELFNHLETLCVTFILRLNVSISYNHFSLLHPFLSFSPHGHSPGPDWFLWQGLW